MNLLCQPADESHADRIADLNCRLALETEGKSLDFSTVQNGVMRGLALSPEVRYFVAIRDSNVIGQLMLTREWSDWRDGWMLWLQSVYVVAEFRGIGVFRQLLMAALETMTAEDGIKSVRLYVEHTNETAKRCYEKLGFKGAGYEVLEMSVPPDSADLRIL